MSKTDKVTPESLRGVVSSANKKWLLNHSDDYLSLALHRVVETIFFLSMMAR